MIPSSKICAGSGLPKLTSSPSKARSIALALCLCAATLSAARADDVDDDDIDDSAWHRFENSHFIAFSNAPTEATLAILEELEYIRAAAAQTPAFVIPDGRAKTLAILPATEAGFARLAPLRTMAGFSQPLDGGAAIVLPVLSASGIDTREIVRHEFGHTMLFNEWFRYPQWYAEGFAEVVSSVTVDRKNNAFEIGRMPKRYGRRPRPAFEWDDLIKDGFDAHRLADDELIQLAYAQYWLLFHYLTLNSETDYAFQLDRYFALVTSGRPSTEAFPEAFGMTASALWDAKLESYARKPPSVTRQFDPQFLDATFTRTEAKAAELGPVLRYLADKADARRPDRPGLQSLEALPGAWDQLKLTDQCSEPLVFDLRPDSNVITIDGFYSAAGARSVPALFAFERIDDGSFRLTNITDTEYPNVRVTSDFRLSLRNENVFCFDQEPVAQTCGSIFQRCNRPDSLLH
jgi:hypothetical protein